MEPVALGPVRVAGWTTNDGRKLPLLHSKMLVPGVTTYNEDEHSCRMTLVVLTPTEIPALREAMYDMQLAVARYYDETSRGVDRGGSLRGFLSAAQRVNELFTNQASHATTYRCLFDPPAEPGTEVVQAVKYARNVHEHLLSIFSPDEDKAMVGGIGIGYRDLEKWPAVPATEHNQLHPTTQRLKPAYAATLESKPITSAMLDLLSFYWKVNPDIVHRDLRGEWTGFPLMEQPGLADRLHPEEPHDLADATEWLHARVPNGTRVVCSQLTFQDSRYLCGVTFTGRRAFSPFAETIDQAQRDIARGAIYLEGDVWANIDQVTLPRAQGPVFVSRSDLDSWATVITEVEREDDWCLREDTEVGTEFWLHVVRPEQTMWAAAAYALRRARRLNACVPPGV